MGRLQTWGAAARRSPALWVGVAVAGAGAGRRRCRAGHAQRSADRPQPVDLDPRRRPRGLRPVRARAGEPVPDAAARACPPPGVSQGPSTRAYPSVVARALGLTMTVRPTNCKLTGDQLAISGAVADAADNTARDGQCPLPPQQARNLERRARRGGPGPRTRRGWSCCRTGPTTSTSPAASSTNSSASWASASALGTNCVVNGTVTPQVAAELVQCPHQPGQSH